MERLVRYFSDHFIPHEGNDHQPHFLRSKAALFFAALLFAAEAFYLVGTLVILPRSEMFAAILASVLVEQTNEKRAKESVGTLAWSPVLERAAQLKANDMAEKGYFAHNTPDGKTPWYWFRLAGYDYAAAGENLAVNFVDSHDVTEAWMRSPTHRANILNGGYTEIGIATARGVYKGREAIFVVQLFGRPGPLAMHTPSNTVAGTTALQRVIAGAEKTEPPSPRPLFAATRPEALGKSTVEITDAERSVTPEPVQEDIAAAERPLTEAAKPSPERANFIARLIASPRLVSIGFGTLFLGLFILALGLNIFINIRIQHLPLIANGVLLAGVVMALIVMNAAIAATLGTI